MHIQYWIGLVNRHRKQPTRKAIFDAAVSKTDCFYPGIMDEKGKHP